MTPPLLRALALTLLLAVGGCHALLDGHYRDTLPPEQGSITLEGLHKPVSVRRNALGMPFIEADSLADASFALGYVHATDRLAQMEGMRLMAAGRLAEMLGAGVLDIDRFMRTVDLERAAKALQRGVSPEVMHLLERYAQGVNRYLALHQGRLPLDLDAAGHHPEPWTPRASLLVFCLLNFGLAANLQEEIAALALAQRVGTERLAWLLPVYPDEPLPFDETAKLAELTLQAPIPGLGELAATGQKIAATRLLGAAASNNWAVAPARSTAGKSLLANDTHLPLAMPSYWNYVHLRTPELQGAGVAIAGLPAVVAGFNGSLAWGMTMVMGDNQDLFLEQLVEGRDGQWLYLAEGEWQPTRQRRETFIIKGQQPVSEIIHETRNGPLLNAVLTEPRHMLQPRALQSGYGLAYRSIQNETDQSVDAFFALSRTKSVTDAFEASRGVRAMALNILFADADSIGWQVTGRYPQRARGQGLLPSPGWDDRYGWKGYVDPARHPSARNPKSGWLGTANHRSVPADFPVRLSSSWYYPERAERLAQVLAAGPHDRDSMIALQYDQTSPFVLKLQAMLRAPAMAQALESALLALAPPEQSRAREALERLLAFDGTLTADSTDAALYAAFLHESARQIFLDELGPEDDPAWQALVQAANTSYSAQADHLLGRDDSPFWDDTSTPEAEDKPAILARSLAAATALLEQRLGNDREAWRWDALHRYHWVTDGSKLAPYLGFTQRHGLKALAGYVDRGPYPAGGDHSTLNVAAYRWGESFDTWLIPAMRIVVDFAAEEPMQGLNSSGQSGNPASPHYADGIQAWLDADYQVFPFRAENQTHVYGERRLWLLP